LYEHSVINQVTQKLPFVFFVNYEIKTFIKKNIMKTIFLITLLFIGNSQMLDATTQNPLLAYSVSYEQEPSSLKKQKKKRLNKKRKQAKLRSKPNPKEGKIRKSLILGGIFAFIFLGTAIGAAALFSGGIGFGALILGVPLILIAIIALTMLIVFFVKSYRLTKKKDKSTVKKTDEDIRNEVPHLSEAKANRYIELRNQLTSINIKKDNFYRNLRTRQKAGTKIKDLIKELNAIHKEHRAIKIAIKNI
jgi:type III secretory pathway component EscU